MLRFIRERAHAEIMVAEGCANADSMKDFEIYGLAEVAKRRGAGLVDLNRDKWAEVEVLDRDLRPIPLSSAQSIEIQTVRASYGL